MTATVRLAPSGKTVTAHPGDTVLSALEREGFALPNNCRAGACGECKTKVLNGEVDQGIVLDMALSTDERADGYRLMCMAKPLGAEVEIEFGEIDAKPRLFPPRDRVLCIVTDTVLRTPSIKEITLRPVGEPLRYWPGQYLLVGDERGGIPLRSYSIANAPRNDGSITLLVSRVADGVTSQWVHEQLTPGAKVTVAGPYGTFIGDPGTDTPVLCLASGSGLAPILALTEAALRRGFTKPVTILFSARTASDVFDEGLVSWWKAKHRRFNFITTYTGDPPDGAAHAGRIPDVLPSVMPDLTNHSVYVAGSQRFVDDCCTAASALGVSPEHLHIERHDGQQPVRHPA